MKNLDIFSHLLEERRSVHRVIPDHLKGQRALEASGVDFAGNVVVPEIPPVVNIGDRVRVPKDDPSYDMLHASSKHPYLQVQDF